MSSPRRRFLKSAAGLAAGAALPCDHQPKLLAQATTSGTARTGAARGTLPTIKLGSHEVSRMIVGGNPFYGYSHFNRLYSQHMVEWATPERVTETLSRCEEQGINTWQISHVERAIADLRRHREQGGRMNWILLSHSEIENDHRLIQEVIKLKPIGIVHHGGSAERKRRQGKLGEITDFLKAVRDSGTLVGLSTHDPDFLEEAQAKNWDIDFFMTSLYYLTRSQQEFEKLLGQKPVGEVYLPEDPPRMCAVIKQTPKPCLVYKVLAAGRLADSPKQIDEAFHFTFQNIKPSDAMIIGMYPRYADHVADNAARVRRVLAS
jgi:hypothetical protein